MSNFIVNDIKRIFGSGNMVSRLIVINVAVFLLVNLVKLVLMLSMAENGEGMRLYGLFLGWIGPDATLEHLPRFWTLVTYGFVHSRFGHIFWNMIIFYWMGRLLGDLLGDKKLLGVYLLGVIAGAVAYVGVSNLFHLITPNNPIFAPGVPLIGASAGVMAVMIAAATLNPDGEFQLILIGPVKLKYLALAMLILTSVIDFWVNTGGKLAHFGGAAMGFIYIRQLQQGNDYAQWMFTLWDHVRNAFAPSNKMKVAHRQKANKTSSRGSKRSSGSSSSSKNSPNRQQQIDIILDKISKSGYESLTKEEKEFLFRVSNNDR